MSIYTKPIEEAKKLLEVNCLKEPPVNAKELALNAGLRVIFIDFSCIPNYQNVSGFIDSNSNTMYVNANEPEKRQNFTIAHELGHYILKHTELPDYNMLYRNASLSGNNNSNLEKEANCFAANLLVPDSFLKNIIKRYPDITDSQLGNLFSVSDIVIRFRRNLLGV